MFALAMAVRATPIRLEKKLHQRDVTTDTHTGDHQLSTEAIIGVVGVVVAVLGIAFTLVWSKRGKSRSKSRRTSEGIHMSKFLHFEKMDLICSTRTDTLQPLDVRQCFYATIPSQYLGAHS
jgi:glucose uptake protein GlcU